MKMVIPRISRKWWYWRISSYSLRAAGTGERSSKFESRYLQRMRRKCFVCTERRIVHQSIYLLEANGGGLEFNCRVTGRAGSEFSDRIDRFLLCSETVNSTSFAIAIIKYANTSITTSDLCIGGNSGTTTMLRWDVCTRCQYRKCVRMLTVFRTLTSESSLFPKDVKNSLISKFCLQLLTILNMLYNKFHSRK